MTYTITTNIPVNPEESPRFPNMKMVLPIRTFYNLAEAKREADERIERFKTAGTVVEVQQRNGRAKYRVVRNTEGVIKRYGLV